MYLQNLTHKPSLEWEVEKTFPKITLKGDGS